ncbi:MAG: hypothetical protein ABL912_01725 [Novosphingobium sp.]
MAEKTVRVGCGPTLVQLAWVAIIFGVPALAYFSESVNAKTALTMCVVLFAAWISIPVAVMATGLGLLVLVAVVEVIRGDR